MRIISKYFDSELMAAVLWRSEPEDTSHSSQFAPKRARDAIPSTVERQISHDPQFCQLSKSKTDQGNSVSLEQIIRSKLMLALEPTRMDVINESELHAGHRSSPGTGESHFRLIVVSPKFTGLSRVARHRLINEALASELAGTLHALAVHAYAPGEPVKP